MLPGPWLLRTYVHALSNLCARMWHGTGLVHAGALPARATARAPMPPRRAPTTRHAGGYAPAAAAAPFVYASVVFLFLLLSLLLGGVVFFFWGGGLFSFLGFWVFAFCFLFLFFFLLFWRRRANAPPAKNEAAFKSATGHDGTGMDTWNSCCCPASPCQHGPRPASLNAPGGRRSGRPRARPLCTEPPRVPCANAQRMAPGRAARADLYRPRAGNPSGLSGRRLTSCSTWAPRPPAALAS